MRTYRLFREYTLGLIGSQDNMHNVNDDYLEDENDGLLWQIWR